MEDEDDIENIIKNKANPSSKFGDFMMKMYFYWDYKFFSKMSIPIKKKSKNIYEGLNIYS